jgi:hypothetical protein
VSNKAAVHFHEFHLPQASLRRLPEDHIAALGVMSYAISELNILSRIYLAQASDDTGVRVIDEIIKAQKLLVLRSWSSKLFEVRAFLASLTGKKPRTQDLLLQKLADDGLNALDKLSSTEGYKAANDIRHEAAHHYSFDAAKKNIAHLPTDALFDALLHRHQGNNFYPLGEYLMFHGRLQRRWKTDQTLREKQVKFEVWLQWCMDAKESVEDIFAKFMSELLFEKLGRNAFYTKTYWIPESLVGHPFDHRTPIVFRFEQDQ